MIGGNTKPIGNETSQGINYSEQLPKVDDKKQDLSYVDLLKEGAAPFMAKPKASHLTRILFAGSAVGGIPEKPIINMPMGYVPSLKGLNDELLTPLKEQIDTLVSKLQLKSQGPDHNNGWFFAPGKWAGKLSKEKIAQENEKIQDAVKKGRTLFENLTNRVIEKRAEIRAKYNLLIGKKTELDTALYTVRFKAMQYAIDVVYNPDEMEDKKKLLFGPPVKQEQLFNELYEKLKDLSQKSDDQTIIRFTKLFLLVKHAEIQIKLLGELPTLDGTDGNKTMVRPYDFRQLPCKVIEFSIDKNVTSMLTNNIDSKGRHGIIEKGLAIYKQELLDSLYADYFAIKDAISYLDRYAWIMRDLIRKIQSDELTLDKPVFPKLFEPGEKWFVGFDFDSGEQSYLTLNLSKAANNLALFDLIEIRLSSPGSGSYKKESEIREEIARQGELLQGYLDHVHEERFILHEKYTLGYDGKGSMQSRFDIINGIQNWWMMSAANLLIQKTEGEMSEIITELLDIRKVAKRIIPTLENAIRFEVKLPYPPEFFISTEKNEKKKVTKKGNEKDWRAMLNANRDYMGSLKYLAVSAAYDQIDQAKIGASAVNVSYIYTRATIHCVNKLRN
ncbi:hypothetical protein KKA47_01225 [bacterium]|nr:hypothetical protein [bacterium]